MAAPLYYDDLSVGQIFSTRTVRVSADEIVAFARQFDPQPFHLDDGAARETVFGGLAASGWHTAALVMRLIVEHWAADRRRHHRLRDRRIALAAAGAPR